MNLQKHRSSINLTRRTRSAASGSKRGNKLHGITPFDVREDRDHNAGPFTVVQLEVILRTPKSGERLSKPWLAMAFDTHGMKLLGRIRCAHEPDGEKLSQLMARVIRKHGQVPKFLATDRSVIARSDLLLHFCARHGIVRLVRPISLRDSGGIERMFRNIQRKLVQAPTQHHLDD